MGISAIPYAALQYQKDFLPFTLERILISEKIMNISGTHG
jgi:hypothetical protein